ncbi:MAG: YihY/virulence factor BrkB family protein [Culturomica sp.]|jgi:membrane protein|nr:YihY/virulence factor BrkB family protein [Culturomica sp.]
MRSFTAKIKKFFSLDFYYAVLRTDITYKNAWSHFLLKALAVIVVSIHRFVEDKITISASALTFYSILSFVPMLALGLGIARGFGMSKILEKLLKEHSFANPEIMDTFIKFAESALGNVNNNIIAGFGIVFLLWTIIKVLGNAEIAMNEIWGLENGRSYSRQFTDYLSIMFIAPLLLIIINGLNVFLTTNLQTIAVEEGFLQYASKLIIHLMNFLPFVLVWLLFIFIYMYIPATKVKFKYALVGGLLAGTIFQLIQWLYIRFQVGVSNYNAIYGSLAAFPLLLVWLQLSWSVLLWGTELSYVVRNRHFLFHSETHNKWSENVEITINILHFIADSYIHNNGAVSIRAISKKFKISVRKLQLLLGELVDKKVLVELEKEDDTGYLPMIDFHHLSVADVIIYLSNVDTKKNSAWEKKYIEAIRNKFSEEKFLQI